jgi:HKD family nuclease
MTIIQHPGAPGLVLQALTELVYPLPQRLRIAVAYATGSGCTLLFDQLARRNRIGALDTIPKEIVVSLDYGVTEPRALRQLMALPHCSVSIADPGVIQRPRFQPQAAYHPKVYMFDGGLISKSLIGSANLTSAALSTNTEAVQTVELSRHEADAMWLSLSRNAVRATHALVAAYAGARRTERPAFRPEQSRPRQLLVPQGLRVFPDAVGGGTLAPAAWDCFWVQTRHRVEGGSANQVEIPRFGHRFFGYHFNTHVPGPLRTIGQVTLTDGAHSWDQKIAWHGSNRMERVHLPTRSQGGMGYELSAVLFRRLRPGVFQLQVAPWISSLAAAWRQESDAQGQTYLLGRGDRLCGLF